MTSAPVRPGLTVRDSQILDLLMAGRSKSVVVEIGVYRRSWTEDDVDRVAAAHLSPATSHPPKKPKVAAPPRPRPAASTPDRWSPPTLREKPTTVTIAPQMGRVLDGICQGLSNRDIGARLFITEDTVKTHVKRLLAALGARDRAHAAALAASGQLPVVIRSQTNRKGS